MRKFILNTIVAACAIGAQAAPFDTVYHHTVFNHRIIHYDEAAHPGSICQENDGTLVIANGRIALRKVCLSRTKRDSRATISVTVRSHGDRWDKAGSVFIIPCSQRQSMISVARGTAPYPAPLVGHEKLVGIAASEGYAPYVELMRFMTPFGVGYYTPTDSATRRHVQPTWLDEYADSVTWQEDITDRLPLLQDSVFVGIAIDSWTPEGYEASVNITLEESTIRGDKAPKRYAIPLVNTIEYYQQEYCDIFARKPLDITFTLPKTVKKAMIYYISTGHGGHSGGDEFTPCENIVSVDGKEVCRYTPWRTDCYSFRRYNPATGVWLVSREATYITSQGTRGQKVIEETLASSDLSRSGWCPGSNVSPIRIPVGTLSAGSHRLRIDIPTAQAIDGQAMNHWLISAWIAWEE